MSIAEAVWLYSDRKLSGAGGAVAITKADLIAKAVWSYSTRLLSTINATFLISSPLGASLNVVGYDIFAVYKPTNLGASSSIKSAYKEVLQRRNSAELFTSLNSIAKQLTLNTSAGAPNISIVAPDKSMSKSVAALIIQPNAISPVPQLSLTIPIASLSGNLKNIHKDSMIQIPKLSGNFTIHSPAFVLSGPTDLNLDTLNLYLLLQQPEILISKLVNKLQSQVNIKSLAFDLVLRPTALNLQISSRYDNGESPWSMYMVSVLRILMNSVYSTRQLKKYLLMATRYVNQDLNLSYEVDLTKLIITPDPVESNDLSFTNLVICKAACLIENNETRAKATSGGILVRAGSASLNTRSYGRTSLNITNYNFCSVYNILRQDWQSGNHNTSLSILSPFVSNTFDPESLSTLGDVDRDVLHI